MSWTGLIGGAFGGIRDEDNVGKSSDVLQRVARNDRLAARCGVN
jgi:hypothetical protein